MIRPVGRGECDGRAALVCSKCRKPLLVLRPDHDRIQAQMDAMPKVLRHGDLVLLLDQMPEPMPVFCMDPRVECRMTSVRVTSARGGDRTWNTEEELTWHVGHCPGCGSLYKREAMQWLELLGILVLGL